MRTSNGHVNQQPIPGIECCPKDLLLDSSDEAPPSNVLDILIDDRGQSAAIRNVADACVRFKP